ncbi:MAG TPA: protoporphyrinogen oxidase, partial [Anaerolineae bacterium]|nr:protoporphyrinogen oxidase [Anaerolineae bacterium]
MGKAHYVVVGGGIAGLTAGYRLGRLAAEAGEEITVTIIEKDEVWGGKVRTEKVDSFVIEAAPDCFLSRKAPGLALCEELGVTERLQGRNVAKKKTYVKYGGQLHRLPEGLTGMIPTNLDMLAESTLLSEAGQARVGEERDLPAVPEDGDESVASFVSRRLGHEAFERLVEPLMGGIYAGDA